MASVGYEEFILSELEHRARVAENSLAELQEAVRWERECSDYRIWIIRRQLFAEKRCARYEVLDTFHAARAAVDALVGEG